MFAFILCLCCPVQVAALRRADHSSKESYQLSISVRLRNLIKRRPRPNRAVAQYKKKNKINELEELNAYIYGPHNCTSAPT
jgi:hypothetical protein